MFIFLRHEKYDKDGSTFRFTSSLCSKGAHFIKNQPSSNHNKPYKLSRTKLFILPIRKRLIKTVELVTQFSFAPRRKKTTTKRTTDYIELKILKCHNIKLMWSKWRNNRGRRKKKKAAVMSDRNITETLYEPLFFCLSY